jgi:large conductance mechanosensitive channel
MLKEFKAFIVRGNVIDMAVGIIIGAAFGKIVTSLVSDILMPPLGWAIGKVDFADLVLNMKVPVGDSKPVVIKYGLFINNILDFVIAAFCIFLVVKMTNALMRKKQPDPTDKKCPQCFMMIPIEAKRCGHCTSTL